MDLSWEDKFYAAIMKQQDPNIAWGLLGQKPKNPSYIINDVNLLNEACRLIYKGKSFELVAVHMLHSGATIDDNTESWVEGRDPDSYSSYPSILPPGMIWVKTVVDRKRR